MYAVIAGIYIYLGIFHLVIYHGKLSPEYNLSFSALCMSMGLLVFVQRLFPGTQFYSENVHIVLKFTSFTAIGISLVYFKKNIFNFERINGFINLMACLLILCGTILLIVYLQTRSILFCKLYYIILSGSALAVMAVCIREIVLLRQYRKKRQIIFLTGFVLIVIHGIASIVLIEVTHSFSRVWNALPGIVVVTIIFSYSMTDLIRSDYHVLDTLVRPFLHHRDKSEKEVFLHNMDNVDMPADTSHQLKQSLSMFNSVFLYKIIEAEKTIDTHIFSKVFDNLSENITCCLHSGNAGKLISGDTEYVDISQMLKNKMDMFKDIANKYRIRLYLTVQSARYCRISAEALDSILNCAFSLAMTRSDPNGLVHIHLQRIKQHHIVKLIMDTAEEYPTGHSDKKFSGAVQNEHKTLFKDFLNSCVPLLEDMLTAIGQTVSFQQISEHRKILMFRLPVHEQENREAVFCMNAAEKNHKNVHPSKHLEDNREVSQRDIILAVGSDPGRFYCLQEHFSHLYTIYIAHDGEDALKKLEHIPCPAIILSDIHMEDMRSSTFIDRLKQNQKHSSVPVILVSDTQIDPSMANYAASYNDVAIMHPFSVDGLALLLETLSAANREKQEPHSNNAQQAVQGDTPQGPDLSPRETEIALLINQGLLYKEIAAEMNISINTVETYRKRLFRKCEVQTRSELIRRFQTLAMPDREQESLPVS